MTQVRIRINKIIPKNISAFQQEKYERRLRKVIEEETQIIENMYMRVGRGFSEKPVFKKEVVVSKGFLGIFGKGNLIGIVSTDSKPFIYIDQGAQQTYQGVPTDDWRPRTTVRTLGIKGRSGGLKFVNKNRRGKKIEARKYSEEIKKRREKPFKNKIRNAMRPKGT